MRDAIRGCRYCSRIQPAVNWTTHRPCSSRATPPSSRLAARARRYPSAILTIKAAKLVPSAFVTANGSRTTDRMPHAGAPLQLLRFLLLGRRLARQYLAKHNPAPWPIVFDELVRIADDN